MKIQVSSRRCGFTLVELLVVIAIIAVLAAAGFAAGNAAIQKARKTTALAVCVALEGAVNNFYTEYGTMPAEGSGQTLAYTDTAEGVSILEVLLGFDSADDLNPRGIKFLNVKEGKAKKNGLIYSGDSGTSIDGLYDPWGNGYGMVLDLDYEEQVTPQRKAGANDSTLNGRRVVVWSDGADVADGGTGTTGDDVITW